jgi:hypothetical protein
MIIAHLMIKSNVFIEKVIVHYRGNKRTVKVRQEKKLVLGVRGNIHI